MGQALIRQKGPAKTAGLWPYQGNRIYPGTLSICHSERPQGAKNPVFMLMRNEILRRSAPQNDSLGRFWM